jgi:hypothetical protein
VPLICLHLRDRARGNSSRGNNRDRRTVAEAMNANRCWSSTELLGLVLPPLLNGVARALHLIPLCLPFCWSQHWQHGGSDEWPRGSPRLRRPGAETRDRFAPRRAVAQLLQCRDDGSMGVILCAISAHGELALCRSRRFHAPPPRSLPTDFSHRTAADGVLRDRCVQATLDLLIKLEACNSGNGIR